MTVPRSRSAEQQTEVEGALSGARTRPDFPPVALHDEPDGDADASPPITPQKAEVLKVDHGADDNAGKHARDEEWRKMALSLAATLDAEEAAAHLAELLEAHHQRRPAQAHLAGRPDEIGARSGRDRQS